MIKYHDINTFSDDGEQIITPVSDIISSQRKTSSVYSPEIREFITNLQKRDDRFYVVINALGSYERWGCNSNGDAFPRESLSHHVSEFTGSPVHDYGYKSFENYAKYFRHHNNKSTSPSYGEVVFSYWNPFLERVELVVALDIFKESKYIKILKDGGNIAVSMGCRVPYDVCNICGHKSPTLDEYCNHTKNYLRRIIGPETAAKWSIEVGRTILPGTQVCVLNTFPIFFDISRVHIGADNVSFMLGKAASNTFFISGADLADSYNVTDNDFNSVLKIANDKIAKDKSATIVKTIPSSEVDGQGIITEKEKVLKRVVDTAIKNEPLIPNNILNYMAQNYSIKDILNSMLSLGIHPKPTEFQRIIIVSGGNKDLADKLEENGEVFPKCDSCLKPSFDISPSLASNSLQSMLSKFAKDRSCYPDLLIQRLKVSDSNIKTAGKANPQINDMLSEIGKMYSSLDANARNSKIVQDSFFPLNLVFGTLLGLKLFGPKFSEDSVLSNLPAERYQDILKGNAFGVEKISTLIAAPMIYKCSAYKQDPINLSNEFENNKIFRYDIEKSTFPW